MFLLISAYIYGLRWKKEDYKSIEPVIFLKKRLIRIFLPLWLMVVLIAVPADYFIAGRFDASAIISNLVGLNWARPFGLSGHLWYITMLMILYVCFIPFSYLRLDRLKWYWWGCALIGLLVLYVVAEKQFDTLSKSVPPVAIVIASIFFYKGQELIEWTKRLKFPIGIVAILATAVSLAMYLDGWHDSHKALASYGYIMAGTSCFMAIMSLVELRKDFKAIHWLSDISYEVFLVHAPLIAVAGLITSNLIEKIIVWFALAIASSITLNRIVEKILKK